MHISGQEETFNRGSHARLALFQNRGIAGTDRTLAATEGGELVTLPGFTGGPVQLWRLDQLKDGSQDRPQFKRIVRPFRRRQQFRNPGKIRSGERQAAMELQAP